MRKLLTSIGAYLDDLLLILGFGCLVAAAAIWQGLALALAVAGCLLSVLAWTVARARRGRSQ